MTALHMGSAAAVSLALVAGVAQAVPPPNIVWIVADDLGYGDLGCYGAKDIPTPHLDALARDGLRSTRFYAMPVCSPTRASLLTGLSPRAAGVETALMGGGGLRGGVPTMPAWLRDRGYRTALVGKWHLGYTGASLPNAQGFDAFFGHLGGKIHYYKHTDELNGQEHPDLWENDQPVDRPGMYATDLFTDRACAFVREQGERPYFLMLAYNAPHYARGRKPGETYGPEHYLQAPPEWLRRTARDPVHPTMRELYAAVVAAMDDGIGRVLGAVDESGARDRTLVVFLSDNGADTGHGGSSGSLSGHKAELSEGGIRAAMMARWPGRLPSGGVLDSAADVRDLWPTCAALAGLPPPAGVEGVDVSPGWLGGVAPARDRCWAWRDEKVVLRGPWKWHEQGGLQRLYDVQNDPGERVDRAADRPDLVSDLAAVWQRWAEGLQEAR